MQLNMEQKKLIQARPNGHSLIRGVAGSGKTTVAVHRADFLFNHYCVDDDDHILLVTYNKTLVRYLRYLYDKVDAEMGDVGSGLFVPGARTDRVTVATVDSLIYNDWQERVSSGNKLRVLYGNPEKYPVYRQAIAELSKQFPKVTLIEQRALNFLLDEIDWIKACNYQELAEYQNADRLGRMSRKGSDGPQRLPKNSETRAAIFELMQLCDRKMLQNGCIDSKTIALQLLTKAKAQPTPRYTHVLVDESQDLTRVQLEYLQTLYNPRDYSSFTFVADTAQSIYSHSWLVKGHSFASIGFDMTGKSSALSKNYRTTTQIAEAAYSLIASDSAIVDDENFVQPSLIDRHGSYPMYRRFPTVDQEAEFVVHEIKDELLREYQPSEIAIIARTKRQLEQISEALSRGGMDSQFLNGDDALFEGNRISLLTMHSMKGLESRVVFIIGLNHDVLPFLSYQDRDDQEAQEITEKKLLYVGMTRAAERLYLSSSGKPSPFIRQINPDFLRVSSRSLFCTFRQIELGEYLFAERSANVYGREEQVRQWMLRQLIDRYRYPSQLLSVEYKVNSFSQIGSVDICVSIYSGTRLVPFIFVETKAFGSGLVEGSRQLQSYMSTCQTVQYGVVTDGNELLILAGQRQTVDDIPLFDRSMLRSSIEQFEYRCLRHGQTYLVTRDGGLPAELSVRFPDQTVEYTADRLVKLPVFTGIAAGAPIQMQDRSEDQFSLPREWVTESPQCYLLQVQGDSMIGAGIDDGDLVLMQYQTTASNRDIVAVALDDEATLKRLMKMGDSLLLIPENERYEPIHVSAEQAKILGVVRGILKRGRE